MADHIWTYFSLVICTRQSLLLLLGILKYVVTVNATANAGNVSNDDSHDLTKTLGFFFTEFHPGVKFLSSPGVKFHPLGV